MVNTLALVCSMMSGHEAPRVRRTFPAWTCSRSPGLAVPMPTSPLVLMRIHSVNVGTMACLVKNAISPWCAAWSVNPSNMMRADGAVFVRLMRSMKASSPEPPSRR